MKLAYKFRFESCMSSLTVNLEIEVDHLLSSTFH